MDGVPSNFPLDLEELQKQMNRRRPGQSALSTKRDEADRVEVLSGLQNGRTLGTSLTMMVRNKDQRSIDYANTDVAPRPGHADYTYQQKYGIRAASGGGRASARETAARVAAGAVAEQWLEKTYGTKIVAFVSSVGDIKLPADICKALEQNGIDRTDVDEIGTFELHGGKLRAVRSGNWYSSGNPMSPDETTPPLEAQPVPVITRCPDEVTACKMAELITRTRDQKDSVGGVCTCVVTNPPVGLGEPVFDKTEALLAQAMMSLPATKGFEMGDGFAGTSLNGSTHNDLFCDESNGLLRVATNHAGGTLGGITTGAPIVFRVAVKPVSSIGIQQKTVTYEGEPHTLAVKGRHDPCVLPRTPPLVEGMAALVLADLCLRQRARREPPVLNDPICESKKARTE
eukprot:GEMP01047547.1.p1 GENE.GEMP01047547.1~~GEMP01047547.1.p1  ORF type:complete len:400 (+),score=95.34 GEMP01047547.1:146-1345(+)